MSNLALTALPSFNGYLGKHDADVTIATRTIGKENATDQWSNQGHAALVFDLGVAGASDHWIAQGGPIGKNQLGAQHSRHPARVGLQTSLQPET
jgi:hypothetical protein